METTLCTWFLHRCHCFVVHFLGLCDLCKNLKRTKLFVFNVQCDIVCVVLEKSLSNTYLLTLAFCYANELLQGRRSDQLQGCVAS